MQADGVGHTGVFLQPGHDLRGTQTDLFSLLEAEIDRAGQQLPMAGQQLCGPEQDGRMGVVAAGVHLARDLGAVIALLRFGEGQGVKVSPDGKSAGALLPRPGNDIAVHHLIGQPHSRQLLADAPDGAALLPESSGQRCRSRRSCTQYSCMDWAYSLMRSIVIPPFYETADLLCLQYTTKKLKLSPVKLV